MRYTTVGYVGHREPGTALWFPPNTTDKGKSALTKIMIVDDDSTTVSLLQTLLELDGFEVLVARQGAEVIPMAEAERPALMMIDQHLNDMEGTEVVRQLRQRPTLASLPIIVASGIDVSDKALAAGADHFLTKPFEPADLPELFNRLLTK